MNAAPSDSITPRRRLWLAPLCAAALAVVIYLPSIGYEFTYDDVGIIVVDHRLDDPAFGLTCWISQWWPDGAAVPISRPLTTFTFWAQTQLHGRNPAYFHLLNVLFYALLCAAMVRLTQVWLRPPLPLRERDGVRVQPKATARRGDPPPLLTLRGASPVGKEGWRLAPWAVGLAFAAHPLHTEIAANVVGRAEILSALLIVIGIILWLLWREAMNTRRAIIMGLCILLAGLAKDSGYLLAPMLLAVEVAERRRRGTPVFRGATPAVTRSTRILLSVVVVVAGLALAQRKIMAYQPEDAPGPGAVSEMDNPLFYATVSQRLVTPLKIIAKAGQLLVAPMSPSPDYSPRMLMPTNRFDDPFVPVGLLIVIAWALAIWWAWRKRLPGLGALLCIPIAWAIPSNTIVLIGTIFGERLLTQLTLFVPIAAMGVLPWDLIIKRAGALLAIAIALASIVFVYFQWQYWWAFWWEFAGAEGSGVRPMVDLVMPLALGAGAILGAAILMGRSTKSWGVAAGAGAIALALAVGTIFYSPTWADNNTQLLVTTLNHPTSGRFRGFLAGQLVVRGMGNPQARSTFFVKAEQEARVALEYWPRQADPYGVLGVVAQWRGEDEKAREYFRLARRGAAKQNLGDYGLASMGEIADAAVLQKQVDELTAHLADQATDRKAMRNLADAYLGLKEYKDAIEWYEKLDPDRSGDVKLLDKYVGALLGIGHLDTALDVYQHWVTVEPGNWSVLTDAALVAIANNAELDKARQWIDKAMALSPGSAEPWAALAQWHLLRGDKEAAAKALDEALRRSPPGDPKRVQYQLMAEELTRK